MQTIIELSLIAIAEFLVIILLLMEVAKLKLAKRGGDNWKAGWDAYKWFSRGLTKAQKTASPK